MASVPRCKGIDLGDWACNRFLVAGNDLTGVSGDALASTGDLKQ